MLTCNNSILPSRAKCGLRPWGQPVLHDLWLSNWAQGLRSLIHTPTNTKMGSNRFAQKLGLRSMTRGWKRDVYPKLRILEPRNTYKQLSNDSWFRQCSGWLIDVSKVWVLSLQEYLVALPATGFLTSVVSSDGPLQDSLRGMLVPSIGAADRELTQVEVIGIPLESMIDDWEYYQLEAKNILHVEDWPGGYYNVDKASSTTHLESNKRGKAVNVTSIGY